MYTEARKKQLISDLLKVSNEETLKAVEVVLKKKETTKSNKSSIYDFVGIINKKEASVFRKAIKENCNKIDSQIWI